MATCILSAGIAESMASIRGRVEPERGILELFESALEISVPKFCLSLGSASRHCFKR